MNAASFLIRAGTACQRRAARWLGRRPFVMPRGRALVSFSFDDFPRSALLNGGVILERLGLAGTYYTALGIANQTTVCGEMFSPDDLGYVLDRGHELGCHTYDHCPAWTTPAAEFAASVRRNAEALQQKVPGAQFRSLSYPISHPRPATKRRISPHFSCCRGGGQTYNIGRVDLNYLSAFFLEQSRHDPDAVCRLLVKNRLVGGWLIFATHDVCERPSRFGCTPAFFRQIVQFAVVSGAEILPVGKAWDVLRARASATNLSGQQLGQTKHAA